MPRISATLTDSLGRPISDAVVKVSALPVARASEVHEATLAATGADQVTLVEGDAISGDDLVANAAAFAKQVTVERRSVESFLARGAMHGVSTVIVDPPRTGLSKDALAGVVRARVPAIVYVSCDVPTLAREVAKDAKRSREGGAL